MRIVSWLLAALLAGVLPWEPAVGQQAIDMAPYPMPTSKKGLQVQMIDDAIALGIRHAAINIDLGALLDLDEASDAITFRIGGHEHRLRRTAVEHIDTQVQPLTAAGE